MKVSSAYGPDPAADQAPDIVTSVYFDAAVTGLARRTY
jgi:hypothetical protein